MRRTKTRRRGQAMVEFALVLPLLVVLLLAFFDASFALFGRLSVDAAVHTALSDAFTRGGNRAFAPGELSAAVCKACVGVRLKPSDVTVTRRASHRSGWHRVEVTVRFGATSLAAMYFTSENTFEQTTRHLRLIPEEVLSP